MRGSERGRERVEREGGEGRERERERERDKRQHFRFYKSTLSMKLVDSVRS